MAKLRIVILLLTFKFVAIQSMEQPEIPKIAGSTKYEPLSLLDLSIDAVSDLVLMPALLQDIIDEVIIAKEENNREDMNQSTEDLSRLIAHKTVQQSSSLKKLTQEMLEQVKKFVSDEINKEQLPKPISYTPQLLQKLPEELQIRIIEHLLDRLDNNTIWLDEDHLIPAFIQKQEFIEFGRTASATQKLIEFIILTPALPKLKNDIIKLAFEYETVFADAPLLVDYAQAINEETDEVEKNRLNLILTELITHASEQNKFEALYYLVLKIITNLERTEESQKTAQNDIALLKILLNAGLTSSIMNHQGQSLIDIVQEFVKPGMTNIEIRSENRLLKILLNQILLTRVFNLLKIHQSKKVKKP